MALKRNNINRSRGGQRGITAGKVWRPDPALRLSRSGTMPAYATGYARVLLSFAENATVGLILETSWLCR